MPQAWGADLLALRLGGNGESNDNKDSKPSITIKPLTVKEVWDALQMKGVGENFRIGNLKLFDTKFGINLKNIPEDKAGENKLVRVGPNFAWRPGHIYPVFGGQLARR